MLGLILKSLSYHARMNVALALGVAAATAVVTGALVVGDSMRGSLRHLALDRLGQIDEAVISDHFFRARLADLTAPVGSEFKTAPVILLAGSLANPESGHAQRASGVAVIGCDGRFWALGSGGPTRLPQKREIVLNEPLAKELSIKVGQEVLLRIGETSQIPADSPLGRKTDLVRTRRLTVSAIIPAAGLGRFGLRPNQQLPMNAYLDLGELQSLVEQPDGANAILARTDARESNAGSALASALKPTLSELGLNLKESPAGYFNLTSTRMILDPQVERQLLAQLKRKPIQPALAYLANTTSARGREIPYSTIAAIDPVDRAPLGPLLDQPGQPIQELGDDEIVLNAWAAEDLGAQIGDEVKLTYFEPESTHGQVRERTAEFRLKAIAPLNGVAADRNFTPELKGITDQLSIGDWDPPFPFDAQRVRKKDEAYWNKYRATPKGFISLAAGRKLWSSRFGQTTSLRIVAPGETADSLAQKIHISPGQAGFQFLPLRKMGLAAAQGTTSFSALFLGFSFFIVAAALMLITLLVRLAVQQRASEIGILAASGWRVRKVAGLLAAEAFFVSVLGGLLGVAGGVGYAWLMLVGLRTWWLSAISTPFLMLHITPASLVAGLLSGTLLSLLVILWSIRGVAKLPVTQMLAGHTHSVSSGRTQTRWATLIAVILLLIAGGAGVAGMRLGGESRAGAFFGSGALVLTASLIWLRSWLRSAQTGASISNPGLALARLALRNGSRNPARSVLTAGLVGAATFLIVAVSAFRLDPTEIAKGPFGGTGGFQLLAQSDQSIYHNLGERSGRAELGMGDKTESLLAKTQIFALRVKPGDDASCLNLYQAAQPRLLGVPQELINRGGFDWAASAADDSDSEQDPWLLLERPLPAMDGHEVIPVVLDMNTAMYSLHLWKGVGERYDMPDGRGGTLHMQVVGLLRNSIFQGELLMSEQNLLRYFPEVQGYRYFLIYLVTANEDAVRTVLENDLADYGLDVQRTVDRLAELVAVQNTYLSTFQTLGALGLLLGTVGLATVQLRSVLERRGELALMRAAGFRKRRLAAMVLLENAALLVAGLLTGLAAALVAVLPHLLENAASLPWASLAATLLAVLIIGLLVGLVVVRAVMRAELLPALRAEA